MNPLFHLAFFLYLTSCASYYGENKFREISNLYYTDSQSLRQHAHAYVPKGKGSFPGVILVHGGGWKTRDLSDMKRIAESLASRGFSVLSINYCFPPENLHPSPITDLENAVIFFRKNAERFKFQPNQVGLWGYSSGAHTVAFYALTRADKPELRVQAVVAGGGPYDLTKYPDSKLVNGYMGNKKSKMEKEYLEASVKTHITSKAPPFFLYHGKNDWLVDSSQASEFAKELKKSDVEVEEHLVPFLGHSATFLFSSQSVKLGTKFLEAKLKRLDAF